MACPRACPKAWAGAQNFAKKKYISKGLKLPNSSRNTIKIFYSMWYALGLGNVRMGFISGFGRGLEDVWLSYKGKKGTN